MKARLIVLAALSVLTASCVALPARERYERSLSLAQKPVHVVSVGRERSGEPCVTFMDASGRVWTTWGAWCGGFHVGEVIEEPHEN